MKINIFYKGVLFAFLFIYSIQSSGQNKTDNEFQRLSNLCQKHARSPDSLLIYSSQLLEYSQKQNLDFGIKKAYKNLGFANSRLRNYEKSNNYYYKALSISRKTNDEKFEYIIYNDLSLNHRATKYYDSALYYYRKLIDYHKTTNNTISINLDYMNIGYTFFSKSNLDSAQVYLDKSIKGFKKNNNLMFMSNNLGTLGEVYFQQNEYKKALKIVDSSQRIAEKINLQRNYSVNYNLFSRIYKKLNNLEESKRYSILEKENRLKMDSRGTNIGGFNAAQQKSRNNHIRNRGEILEKEKIFYKSNLFIILFLAICLSLISFYLYRKSKGSQKEVLLLQNKLNKHSENKKIEAKELIHLNNKVVIDLNNVQFIKSEGHYLEFHIEGKDKPEIDRNSLLKISEILPTQSFVRIHKSYIVNIQHVKIINSTKLMLKSGKWINLSRTYKQHLREILNIK